MQQRINKQINHTWSGKEGTNCGEIHRKNRQETEVLPRYIFLYRPTRPRKPFKIYSVSTYLPHFQNTVCPGEPPFLERKKTKLAGILKTGHPTIQQ
jgi:hypothetical protein